MLYRSICSPILCHIWIHANEVMPHGKLISMRIRNALPVQKYPLPIAVPGNLLFPSTTPNSCQFSPLRRTAILNFIYGWPNWFPSKFEHRASPMAHTGACCASVDATQLLKGFRSGRLYGSGVSRSDGKPCLLRGLPIFKLICPFNRMLLCLCEKSIFGSPVHFQLNPNSHTQFRLTICYCLLMSTLILSVISIGIDICLLISTVNFS